MCVNGERDRWQRRRRPPFRRTDGRDVDVVVEQRVELRVRPLARTGIAATDRRDPVALPRVLRDQHRSAAASPARRDAVRRRHVEVRPRVARRQVELGLRREILLPRDRRAHDVVADGNGVAPPPEVVELDPRLACALRSLSPVDCEALLLVAWEDLTPTKAARSLGISPTAFRVRLLRARRRLRAKLDEPAHDRPSDTNAHLDLEAT